MSCLYTQGVQKQGTAYFQAGVLKLDLSSAFNRLWHKLGGLDDLSNGKQHMSKNEKVLHIELQ